jgi:hypothetical protein
MMTLKLPYTIPKSEISGDLTSLGFSITDTFLSQEVVDKLHTILISDGNELYSVKMSGSSIKPDTQFCVIEDCDVPRDISSEVSNFRNIIISTQKAYVYPINDHLEPFKPKKGDSFVTFTSKEYFSEVSMLILILGLRIALSSDLSFRMSAADGVQELHILVPKTANRKQVLDKLSIHAKEIEKLWNIQDFTITRRYTPPFKDIDDFEKE